MFSASFLFVAVFQSSFVMLLFKDETCEFLSRSESSFNKHVLLSFLSTSDSSFELFRSGWHDNEVISPVVNLKYTFDLIR